MAHGDRGSTPNILARVLFFDQAKEELVNRTSQFHEVP